MNNTIKELIERKSTRLFTDKEISKEDKDLIITSAINAPTAGNMQLYSIIDIKEQKLKDELAILCDNQSFISDSKLCLIFCADYYKWQKAFVSSDLKPRDIAEGDMLLAMEDAIIAAQNTVVGAHSLGIESCYIGDIMENAEKVIDLLKLPGHVYPACMLVFGYPKAQMAEKPKRVDNKYVVFENEYKELNKDELKDMLFERTQPKGYEEWMKAFMERKHNSDFSKEMNRSAKVHIDNFNKKCDYE